MFLFRTLKHIKNSERGDINLALVALAFPIIVVLFATVLDLARVPLTKKQLTYAIYTSAYQVTPSWVWTTSECTGVVPFPGSGNSGSANLCGFFSAQASGIEPYTPAAHNFSEIASFNSAASTIGVSTHSSGSDTCLSTATPGSDGNVSGFFTGSVASNYLENAVGLGHELASTGSWFLSRALQSSGSDPLTDDDYPLAVEFGIYRIVVDPTTGKISSTAPSTATQITTPKFYPDATLAFSNLVTAAGLSTSPSPAQTIIQNLADKYEADDVVVGWPIETCSDPTESECSTEWLDPLFLVGVGLSRIDNMLGGLKLLNNNETSDTQVVFSYVVRPLNNVGGIQRNVASDPI